jgi:hypothetical protein
LSGESWQPQVLAVVVDYFAPLLQLKLITNNERAKYLFIVFKF